MGEGQLPLRVNWRLLLAMLYSFTLVWIDMRAFLMIHSVFPKTNDSLLL